MIRNLMQSGAWLAAGWTMVHFLWLGCGIGLLAAIGKRALRPAGPHVRYAFLLACLAALVACPPVIGVWVFDVSVSAPVRPVVHPPAVDPETPALEVQLQDGIVGLARGASTEVSLPSGVVLPASVHSAEEHGTETLEAWVAGAVSYLPWVWLMGSPLTFVLVAAGLMGAERLRRDSRRLDAGPVWSTCQQVADALGVARRVTLGVCDRLAGPILIGVVRPMILLPPAALVGWSVDELEMVLLHELAHVRRWDNLVNLLQRVVESLLFFHPVVWLVSRWVRIEREHCCDRLVVRQTGRPRAYAEVLAGFATGTRPMAAVAMGEKGIMTRVRRILDLEDGSHRVSRNAIGLLAVVMTGAVLLLAGYAQHAARAEAARSADQPGASSSTARRGQADTVSDTAPVDPNDLARAWFMLRQTGVGPLLAGLAPKLDQVRHAKERTDPVWAGVDGGGSVDLHLTAEGRGHNGILIGLFGDPRWRTDPIQARAVTAPGRYTLDRLPPGEYVVGAMAGNGSGGASLGVHRSWPRPIEIRAGQTTEVHVLISPDFRSALGMYNREIGRAWAGRWPAPDPDRLLRGRVTGSNGEPVPYAIVQIRQHNPDGSSIMAPETGTNETGRYQFDDIHWPYKVGAIRYEPMPSVFAYRHQYLPRTRVFEGPQAIDFRFDPWPEGTAGLRGRVLDQHGRPLEAFFLDVRSKGSPAATPDASAEYGHCEVGYHVPYIAKNGRFELNRLPAGEMRVGAIAFDTRTYAIKFGLFQDVTLTEGKTTEVTLHVEKTEVFYGRVLFKDDRPALVTPTPWPGAATEVWVGSESLGHWSGKGDLRPDGGFVLKLSADEVKDLRSGKQEIDIALPTPKQKGEHRIWASFPLKLLSRDPGRPGVLRIERPEVDPVLAAACAYLDMSDAEVVRAAGHVVQGLKAKGKILGDIHDRLLKRIIPGIKDGDPNRRDDYWKVCDLVANAEAMSLLRGILEGSPGIPASFRQWPAYLRGKAQDQSEGTIKKGLCRDVDHRERKARQDLSRLLAETDLDGKLVEWMQEIGRTRGRMSLIEGYLLKPIESEKDPSRLKTTLWLLRGGWLPEPSSKASSKGPRPSRAVEKRVTGEPQSGTHSTSSREARLDRRGERRSRRNYLSPFDVKDGELRLLAGSKKDRWLTLDVHDDRARALGKDGREVENPYLVCYDADGKMMFQLRIKAGALELAWPDKTRAVIDVHNGRVRLNHRGRVDEFVDLLTCIKALEARLDREPA